MSEYAIWVMLAPEVWAICVAGINCRRYAPW
jgi:hypothetical protein